MMQLDLSELVFSLLIISVIIAIKIKGLLVGQSASPEQVVTNYSAFRECSRN